MKLFEYGGKTIILLNLFTLFTGLLWQIDVSFFLLFYWFESIVAGIFNVLKMGTAKNNKSPLLLKLILIPFFIIHYGLFNLGHLLFLTIFIGEFNSGVGAFSYVLEYFQLFIFNILLLVIDYIQDYRYWVNESEEDHVGDLMFKPYGRIVAMHMTLIFGAFLYFYMGSNRVFIIILMILKTLVDLRIKKIYPG